MRTSELHAALEAAVVRVDAYSIGRDDNESHCLVEEAGLWHVFYSERGNRNSEAVFADEDSACSSLLERILRDAAARIS